MPTLETNAALESRKKLVGIAKNVSRESIATALSAGSSILSTEQEVRDTKKVRVLVPFLVGSKKVADVLTEAQGGGVKTIKAPIGERTVSLANELITDPVIWRPRDGEILEASSLLGTYQAGFQISATKAKDEEYFKTIATVGKAGLSTGEKMAIVEAKVGTDEASRTAFAGAIKDQVDRIMDHEDGVIAGEFAEADLAIVLSRKGLRSIVDHAQYDVFNEQASAAGLNEGKLPTGKFYGINVYVATKSKLGVNTNALIMVKSAAVSQFLFMDGMNADKVAGVNAFKLSLEFNAGTGFYFPQLVSLLVEDKTVKGLDGTADAEQAAVGSGKAISTPVDASTTESVKPA